MSRYRIAAATALLSALVLTGCGGNADKRGGVTPPGQAKETKTDEVAAERAKLPPDERALVEAQEWCVVNADERLGSMGPPVRLDIKGQTVFICCKGCKRRAEADADRTLAKAEDLRAKARVEKDAKK